MVKPSDKASKSVFERVVPAVGWLRDYQGAWFRPDVVAGLAVAALVVPKALGYAEIAAVPIEHGLYAAAAGTILYALFGTSRQISTGPSSALAAMAGSAVVLSAVGQEGQWNWSPPSLWPRDCCCLCWRCSEWAGSRSSCRAQ